MGIAAQRAEQSRGLAGQSRGWAEQGLGRTAQAGQAELPEQYPDRGGARQGVYVVSRKAMQGSAGAWQIGHGLGMAAQARRGLGRG